MTARQDRWRKLRKRKARRLRRAIRDRQSLRHKENVVKDAIRMLTTPREDEK
jgi:hypothetical protein